ncbi:MAG: TetR/AcrR family transcriptional regulator [Oscillospiraceae bacterium]|nr:TetR/AcrR family transcriptional regulator [Oscillospiraceae bacterium]
MGTINSHDEKRTQFLELCFDCFCEHGLEGTTARNLCEACGTGPGNLFTNYFSGKDEIIIEATAYCMAKVEADFMNLSPQSIDDVERFLREMPYITERKHGAKYRFMYQVYCSPKYEKYGEEFFDGVTERYSQYAAQLAPRLGMPQEIIQPLIFIFVRACVHYAMFRNENYLKPQIELLILMVKALKGKYPI